MQIRTRYFLFKPHFGLSLLVIFFLPILLGLAYWQLQRGLHKQELLNTYHLSQTETAVNLHGQSSLPLKEFQPVRVTGKFASPYRFYLDNQIYAGRAGFEILAPLQLTTGEWLLINLGWLPRNIKRDELPKLPPLPQEVITLQGRADFPSPNYLVLGTRLEKLSEYNLIIQAIDYPELNQVLGFTLLPVVLLTDADSNTPFTRDWQPPANMPPAKHFGYAAQWLLLAMTLCVLYVIFCTKRIKLDLRK